MVFGCACFTGLRNITGWLKTVNYGSLNEGARQDEEKLKVSDLISSIN